MHLFGDPATWLPVTFAGLMGLSILIYVILDGFDLGVGVLLPLANPDEKDRMIASIGPFWDANENLAGDGHRLASCGPFSGRPRHDPDSTLSSGSDHAGRTDPARRGVRVPRKSASAAKGDVEQAVLCRLTCDCSGAGLHARSLHHGAGLHADDGPVRHPDRTLPGCRIWLHRRHLADHQDRRPAAAQSSWLGAQGAGRHHCRNCSRIPGNTICQPTHSGQMVPDSRVPDPGAPCR